MAIPHNLTTHELHFLTADSVFSALPMVRVKETVTLQPMDSLSFSLGVKRKTKYFLLSVAGLAVW
jgi:hypothetical protein